MCFPPSLYSQMHYFIDIVDTSIGFILCIDAIYSLIKFCNMELSFHSLHSHYKYDPLWPSIMAPSLPQGPSHIYHGPRLPQWSQPHLSRPQAPPVVSATSITAPGSPSGLSHIYHGPRHPQWSQPHLSWPQAPPVVSATSSMAPRLPRLQDMHYM
jgi:hypothetical protein